MAKNFYRRNLPHCQGDGRPIFVTFRTVSGFILPSLARDLVARHLLHDHGRKLRMQCYVIMPDHVHFIYEPMRVSRDRLYSLEEILNPIEGASSHSINRLLHRKGSVWLDESFDH